MRIIAGEMKGTFLQFPNSKNTRPLKDMVRENIFNILLYSNKILLKFEPSDVLDLYAGSGSFGLECLSRNANKVCFVENEKKALDVLEKNIKNFKKKEKAVVFANDVFDVINKQNKFNFDLIFCDPPFANNNIKDLIDLISKKSLLKKNGIVVIHRNKITKDTFSKNFKIIDERIYGISKITFGQILS